MRYLRLLLNKLFASLRNALSTNFSDNARLALITKNTSNPFFNVNYTQKKRNSSTIARNLIQYNLRHLVMTKNLFYHDLHCFIDFARFSATTAEFTSKSKFNDDFTFFTVKALHIFILVFVNPLFSLILSILVIVHFKLFKACVHLTINLGLSSFPAWMFPMTQPLVGLNLIQIF